MYVIRDIETGDIVVCENGATSFSLIINAEAALYKSIAWQIHCEMTFLEGKGYKDLVKQFKDSKVLWNDYKERYGSVPYDVEMECGEALGLVQEKLMELGYYTEYLKDNNRTREEKRKISKGRFIIEQVTSFKTKEEELSSKEDLWKAN